MPIIYLRQQVHLGSQQTIREVVDGQQRLRTLFAFIDPSSLEDYDATKDATTISQVHNKELAGKSFAKLNSRTKERILSYEFSTHVLPINIEDREILEIFARLNSTGVKLSHQELRNAQWFGEFKTLMYELALEQLERWRDWSVFSDDNIARMKEVEFTSDAVMNMKEGLTGKTQKRIDKCYEKHDETLDGKVAIRRRFRHTMDEIDHLLGPDIATTVYRSEVYFFSLFVYIYDRLWGLGSRLGNSKPKKLPSRLRQCLLKTGERFQEQKVPREVLDAIQRASADLGRRRTRLEYMKSQCDA